MAGDIRHWRHVDAVTRLGSFHEAAVEQSITQSALSKSISSLEALLGVSLFTRSKRGVAPTPELERLQPFIHRLLAAAQEMGTEAQFIRNGDLGEVAIGTDATPNDALLRPTVAKLNERFADLNVKVLESGSNQLFKMLFERDLDLILSFGAITVDCPQTNDLAVEILPREELVMLVRKGHPLTQIEGKPLAYVNYPWLAHHISPDYATNFPTPFRELFAVVEFRCRFITSVVDRIECIENSDTVGLFPASLARRISETRQTQILDLPFPLSAHYILFFLKDRPLRPAAQLLLSELRQAATDLSKTTLPLQ